MRNLNMKHLITLHDVRYTQNELGDFIEEWYEFGKSWAAIKTVKGKEYFQAASYVDKNTYRFIIRYMPGISPKMKLFYNDLEYKIDAALNDDENNRTITIIATAIV